MLVNYTGSCIVYKLQELKLKEYYDKQLMLNMLNIEFGNMNKVGTFAFAQSLNCMFLSSYACSLPPFFTICSEPHSHMSNYIEVSP